MQVVTDSSSRKSAEFGLENSTEFQFALNIYTYIINIPEKDLNFNKANLSRK